MSWEDAQNLEIGGLSIVDPATREELHLLRQGQRRILTIVEPQGTWRERVAVAWSVLNGSYLGSMIVIDGEEAAILAEHLVDRGATRARKQKQEED